jgi:rubredoxin
VTDLEGWLDDPDALYGGGAHEPPNQRPIPRPPEETPGGRPLVFWVPVACPRCGARKPRTTGHYNATRYHRCQGCQLLYDSEELDPTPHIPK